MSATTIALFSLGVAAVGAVTAIVSLMWQVATRARGAHRVKVKTQFAFVLEGGFDDDDTYVSIEVVNRGISPVQVRSYGIEVPGGGVLIPTANMLDSPQLPYMLEGGTSTSFYMSAKGIVAQIGSTDPRKLRAYVQLATGQKPYSKRGSLASIHGK